MSVRQPDSCLKTKTRLDRGSRQARLSSMFMLYVSESSMICTDNNNMYHNNERSARHHQASTVHFNDGISLLLVPTYYLPSFVLVDVNSVRPSAGFMPQDQDQARLDRGSHQARLSIVFMLCFTMATIQSQSSLPGWLINLL